MGAHGRLRTRKLVGARRVRIWCSPPPLCEHAPPPPLACMGGGGGGCVGAVDAMGCMVLVMTITQLYDTVAGSRGGPIARTDHRGPTRRACHGPTDRRGQRRWGGMYTACHGRGWWWTTRWCSIDASGPPLRSAVLPGARRARPSAPTVWRHAGAGR